MINIRSFMFGILMSLW